MENAKQPINPIEKLVYFDKEKQNFAMGGLTKREYFSAMAMQGMINGRALDLSKDEADLFASQSIQFADSLLKQLEQ